jgi:hypothetical protein
MLAVLSATTMALAQRSAGSKMLGTAYEGWSAGMYQDHAYDHARILQEYASSNESIPQEIAKRHAEAVRHNVTAAKKAFANVAAASKDDPVATAHLRRIEAQHAKALAHCDMMDKECAKGECDAKAMHKHCGGAAESLKAAHAEHDKLMKHLKAARPTAKPAETR